MPVSVLALMRRQYGLITAQQAYLRGMTPAQVRHLLSRGDWVPFRRGVYRSAMVPPSWEADLIAELLRDEITVGSHRWAARVWALEGSRPCRPEIMVPHPTSGRRKFAIVHGSTQFDLFAATVWRGIRVTPVDRTLIDCAGVVQPSVLVAMIDDALRRRLVTYDRLVACLARHSVQGRTGAGSLRTNLELRRKEERVPLSQWSRWVAQLLTEHGLPAPVLEHRIEYGGSFLAQVDPAYPELGVAIELDSVSFHLRRDRFTPDAVRRNRITNAGWRLITVTWELYVDQPSVLLADVRQAISGAGPISRGA